jgi:chaperonin cofactor prefoldin
MSFLDKKVTTLRNPGIPKRGKPEITARAFDKVNPKTGARPDRSTFKLGKGDYHAVEYSDEGDFIMVSVHKDNVESTQYWGVNVIFMPDGHIEASCADKYADEQWHDDREKIIKAAKAGLKNSKLSGMYDGMQGVSVKRGKQKLSFDIKEALTFKEFLLKEDAMVSVKTEFANAVKYAQQYFLQGDRSEAGDAKETMKHLKIASHIYNDMTSDERAESKADIAKFMTLQRRMGLVESQLDEAEFINTIIDREIQLGKKFKASQLDETLSPQRPSADDIEFSLKKIDDVISEINELKDDPKYKAKSNQTSLAMVLRKMEIAKDLHNNLDKYNDLKADLDAAWKAKDVEKFQVAQEKMRKFLYDFGLTKKLMDAKRGTRGISGWSVSKAYEIKLNRLLDTMAAVRDGAADSLKRMKMTDGQKSAADKASANMRARWGSY